MSNYLTNNNAKKLKYLFNTNNSIEKKKQTISNDNLQVTMPLSPSLFAQ